MLKLLLISTIHKLISYIQNFNETISLEGYLIDAPQRSSHSAHALLAPTSCTRLKSYLLTRQHEQIERQKYITLCEGFYQVDTWRLLYFCYLSAVFYCQNAENVNIFHDI